MTRLGVLLIGLVLVGCAGNPSPSPRAFDRDLRDLQARIRASTAEVAECYKLEGSDRDACRARIKAKIEAESEAHAADVEARRNEQEWQSVWNTLAGTYRPRTTCTVTNQGQGYATIKC
jgi:hypothetical protein